MASLPPSLLVLLAILCIQLGAAVAVQLFPRLGPTGTVFLRIVLSALLLLAMSRPRLNANTRHHAGAVIVFGLLLTVMNLGFYQAIARIPLGVAVTIEFLGPLTVAVVTSRRAGDFLWIALALTGVALLSPVVGSDTDPIGMAFALAAGSAWGGFILLGRRLGRVLGRGDGLTLGMCVASVVMLPLAIADGGLASLDAGLLAVGLLVAVLATTLPLSLEFAALKRLPPRAYGVLVTVEPAVAMLVGVALLGERLTLPGTFAVALVTVAALGMTRTARND